MEFTWKKILLIGGLFMLIIVGPLFLLSNPMMDYYQKRCDRDPVNNKWLQLKIGDLCYKTMRQDRAKPAYRTYYDRYEDDPMREYALFRWAMCVEETETSKAGIAAFEQFKELYPSGEYFQQAEDGIVRIRYSKTPR